MNEQSDFLAQLQEAVALKYAYVNSTILAALKENYRSLQSNFDSLVQLCQKKGILRSDPYKKERQISEVVPPEDAPLGDSYVEDELSLRLSEFEGQLDFLNNYMSFNADQITLKELKSLLGMVRFIRWTEFSTNSTKPTTRAFADVLDKIKKGSDSFAAGAVNSSLNQCSKLATDINNQLKHLTYLKREEYKLDIRAKILAGKDFGTAIPSDVFTREVKKSFSSSGMTQPYFSELIDEIYEEDFGENSEDSRKKIFQRLEVPQKKITKVDKSVSFKETLLEGLRNLGTSSRHIDISIHKAKENSALLQSQPRSFMEKFREWIIQLSSGKDSDILYDIELIDPQTTAHVAKEINFTTFCTMVEKKSRVLQGFMNKQGPTYQKLRSADEDQLFTLLEKNIVEVNQILQHLEALDAFFKVEITRSQREQIKGTKNEATAIQNSLQAASQKKHEYIAKKDELEQLKKLGIQT